MIQAWRNLWYIRTNGTTDPAFPFGFVQVTYIESKKKEAEYFLF